MGILCTDYSRIELFKQAHLSGWNFEQNSQFLKINKRKSLLKLLEDSFEIKEVTEQNCGEIKSGTGHKMFGHGYLDKIGDYKEEWGVIEENGELADYHALFLDNGESKRLLVGFVYDSKKEFIDEEV